MTLRFILPVMLLAATACSKSTQPVVESYPLPSVPASVTEPGERASIVCAHFWDDAQFPYPPTDSISPELEQAMANFASIAALASSRDSVARGAAEMVCKGGSDYIMPLAERYLYYRGSPMRNEEIFLLFLQAAPDWERTPLIMPEVMQNRIGSEAPDFEFTDAKGKKGSLSRFVTERGETLVYFFDSECVTCKERIPYADEAAEGRAIIAVCPQNYSGAFTEAAAMFPEHWTVVRDSGEIETDDLYLLPSLPSAYIIGADMTILAKDLLL